MKHPQSRREFLGEVGKGMVAAAVGLELASELGIAIADEAPPLLHFGDLESLVVFMQETPVDKLMPAVVEKWRGGTDLRQLVGAAALANARTFGGEDYVGFHTIMALAPAWHMSRNLPPEQQLLPVMKVIYRNTNRIQQFGGRLKEVLQAVAADRECDCAGALADAVHSRNVADADKAFVGRAAASVDEAFNELLHIVQENPEVHRVVLPYRAWDLLGVIGREHATTLLRQSVHYCVKSESHSASAHNAGARAILPRMLEEYHLLGREPGSRQPDDAWVESLSQTFFTSTPEQAAGAAAAALSEGFSPDAVGEAISLAANQLVLRDHGRPPAQETAGKPIGSVHGDSIGVHASDSANAWRHLVRAGNARNKFACLVIGAYQVARDRTDRGGDFLNWQPLPYPGHVGSVKSTDAAAILSEINDAIRGGLQARAAALVAHYGALGNPERPVFDLLLKYAISEDGALHAEKYYRTVSEEFADTRPAFRWRQLVALARVTASEFGRPAPGVAETRALLGV